MEMKTDKLLQNLQNHSEPLIRWKVKQSILENSSALPEFHLIKAELDSSRMLQTLLRDRNNNGQISYNPYDKWFGAHWILSILADLGYPKGDGSLKPLLEQCYSWLLSDEHRRHIKVIDGRVRRCASQEGNCIFYSLALGLADERTDELADRLLKWQWDDGGWNCDKKPNATNSSFNETLIPLRGLAYYAFRTGDSTIKKAAARAAEVFLTRHLFRRIKDGSIIDRNFVFLHYPNYWHYDILFGLKVMAEAGYIKDPRCNEALDLLESKQLPEGGFPAEARYYRVDDKKLAGHSRVDWGGTSTVRMNPFVSMDAMTVLKQAGRLIN